MKINQIREWIKANKLLSAIIVGVIIVIIILYSGLTKQAPKSEEQSPAEVVKTPTVESVEAPTEKVTAPETSAVETPTEVIKPTEAAPEVPTKTEEKPKEGGII